MIARDQVKIYCAKVEEVHSADDYILLVNLGVDGLFKRVRVRLMGVDAPNAYKTSVDSEASVLREECRRLLSGRCSIEVVSEGKGGWIVKMFTHEPDTTRLCLNDILRARGYTYNSARKESGV